MTKLKPYDRVKLTGCSWALFGRDGEETFIYKVVDGNAYITGVGFSPLRVFKRNDGVDYSVTLLPPIALLQLEVGDTVVLAGPSWGTVFEDEPDALHRKRVPLLEKTVVLSKDNRLEDHLQFYSNRGERFSVAMSAAVASSDDWYVELVPVMELDLEVFDEFPLLVGFAKVRKMLATLLTKGVCIDDIFEELETLEKDYYDTDV